MRTKPLWMLLSIIAALCLALVIVPPFVNLDGLKPRIESALLNQTGLHAIIRGPVRVSLLGRATISAGDIVVGEFPDGSHIESVSFSLPLWAALDLGAAKIPNEITVSGARLKIETLSPPSFDNRITIRNSAVLFMGKTYRDINGHLHDGMFSGTIRTDEHKYAFRARGGEFEITNPNVGLVITGSLATDGGGRVSASGTLDIETDRINEWFAFSVPRIRERVALSMKYDWSEYDFRFYDIAGTIGGGEFSGEVVLSGGRKSINFSAHGIDFDMSFLLSHPEFLKNSDLDLTLSGGIAFGGRKFGRVRLQSSGAPESVSIRNLEFAGIGISGAMNGEIDRNGARLDIGLDKDAGRITCAFAGTPDNWSCENWTYESEGVSARGGMAVSKDLIELQFNSDDFDSAIDFSFFISRLSAHISRPREMIKFALRDGLIGEISVAGDARLVKYRGHKNTTLSELPGHDFIRLLPESWRAARGEVTDAVIDGGKLTSFGFRTRDWSAEINESGRFYLNAGLRPLLRAYFPELGANFLNAGLDIGVRGVCRAPYISDLSVMINGASDAELSGKFDGKTLDLRAGALNLDAFVRKDYLENYESEQFVSPEPMTSPFMLGIGLTLAADTVQIGGREYANFNYALKDGSQTMSITDASRGSMLLALYKDRAKYKITLQANKFELAGKVLGEDAALNIADSTLTARGELETSGLTAYDFWNNMRGKLDMTFDGGALLGVGIDEFYANSAGMTRLNLGEAVESMLSGGRTAIKTMVIAGEYERGEFKTAQPLELRARHADIFGDVAASGRGLAARLGIMLRGTSPMPEPITLSIAPNGSREYSAFGASSKIDPDFLREFVRTHEKW
jgi:hypothetical protein